MAFSWSGWNVPLLSGLIGAVCAQLLSAFLQRKLEIRRTNLEILRKIAGSWAAITDNPLVEHRLRFFEGLNELMVVFSASRQVTNALIQYKAALGSRNHDDRLIFFCSKLSVKKLESTLGCSMTAFF
jgi:hypothetical protein